MRKFFSFLLFTFLSITTAFATEAVFYTLDGTITDGSNGYATASEITQNGIDWIAVGNTTISPWRIGGKNLSGVDREVYSQTQMGTAITKVELEVGGITLSAVNSITLIIASDAEFNTELQSIEKTTITANSTLTFNPTGSNWATNAYYKFVFNVDAGGSNSYIHFKSAKFYYDAGDIFIPQTQDVTINGIYQKVNSITTGDVVYMVNETSSKELSGINTSGSNNYGAVKDYTGSIAGLYPLTIVEGDEDNTYAFQHGTDYLSWTENNSMSYSTTLDNNSSWTLVFDEDDNAVITNNSDNSRVIKYNSSSPRFACYTSGQQPIQLYKQTSPNGYATLFLDYPVEIPDGVTVYTAELSGNVVTLTENTGDYLPENTGVIIYGTPNTYTFTETQETVSPVASDLIHDTPADTVNYIYYGLHTGTQGLGFYRFKGSKTLPPNKAFLKVAKSQQGSAPEHLGVSFATDSTYTRLSIFSDTSKTYKYFHNGILYIKQNNNTYNILGIKVD